MRSNKRINIYSPLRFGGVRAWSLQLTQKLEQLGYSANDIHSIPGYVLQPFSTPLTHSTLPFPRPIRGKYIMTVHGVYTEEPLLWSKLYPYAISTADVVTVPCRFLKEKLKLKNAQIIPNGIKKPLWTKKSYILIDTKPTLGILTNFSFLNKAKGLIELAKILNSIPVKVKLLIGGKPDKYFNEIKTEIIKLGIDCEFLGFCNKDDFCKKIDIFTYYSGQDVFSIALLEAMSYGIPCISNDIGGTPEMYNNKTKDLLVSNNKKYSEVLSELISSEKLRKKFGTFQRERASDFYWDNIISKWIEIYNK